MGDSVKTVKKVKALNLATDQVMVYSANYRFALDPKHMFAPPFFTDATAFVDNEIKPLIQAIPGDEVFIEWIGDRFYVLDQETGEYVPGPTVWRRSKIIGVIEVPVK